MNFKEYLSEHEEQLDELNLAWIKLIDKGIATFAKKMFDKGTAKIIQLIAKKFPEIELLRKAIETELRKGNSLAEDKKLEFRKRADRLKQRILTRTAYPAVIVDKMFEPIDKLLVPGVLPRNQHKIALKKLSGLGSVFNKFKKQK